MDQQSTRAGDQDRTKVNEILFTARGEGRLDDAEMAARQRAVAEARTFGELDDIVADLPVPPPSGRLQRAQAPGTWPDDALRLQAGLSSDKRVGRWIMPEFIELSGGFGTVKLDCLQAICEHDLVNIRVAGGMGSIKIVVPHGWAASIDRVSKGIGSVTSKVANLPAPGMPMLHLTGDATAGSIVVRHANWFERRRLRKAEAKGLTGGQPLALPPGTAEWIENNDEMPNSDSLR